MGGAGTGTVPPSVIRPMWVILTVLLWCTALVNSRTEKQTIVAFSLRDNGEYRPHRKDVGMQLQKYGTIRKSLFVKMHKNKYKNSAYSSI